MVEFKHFDYSNLYAMDKRMFIPVVKQEIIVNKSQFHPEDFSDITTEQNDKENIYNQNWFLFKKNDFFVLF